MARNFDTIRIMQKLLLALCCFIPAALTAAPISGTSLSFDGFKNGEQVLAYYAGGFGGEGSGPGPNDGVSFTAGLAADLTQIAFGPSAVVTGPSVTMNLDNPWPQTVSFYFTGNGVISFYSGLNATGSLLRTSNLTSPPSFPFSAVPGPFESAVITAGPSSTLRLDSITFGSSAVIPEPSWLLWSHSAFSAASARKRSSADTAPSAFRNDSIFWREMGSSS
jgi:hypothetical protein